MKDLTKLSVFELNLNNIVFKDGCTQDIRKIFGIATCSAERIGALTKPKTDRFRRLIKLNLLCSVVQHQNGTLTFDINEDFKDEYTLEELQAAINDKLNR